MRLTKPNIINRESIKSRELKKKIWILIDNNYRLIPSLAFHGQKTRGRYLGEPVPTQTGNSYGKIPELPTPVQGCQVRLALR